MTKLLTNNHLHTTVFASLLGLSTFSTHSYAQGTSLGLGQSLQANQFLVPEAGDRSGCSFKGLLQSNGRFILSNAGTATYSMPPSTSSVPNSLLTLQNTGNLAIISPTNVVKWSSNTAGKGVVKAFIRNDGNMQLVNAANTIIWQTNTPKAECNIGPKGIQGIAGYKAVVRSNTLAAGSECSSGGVAIESFNDVNANGNFDSGTDISYERRIVCNGTNGTNGSNGANGANGTDGANSLVMRTPIAPGNSTCPNGGVSIRAFIDNDRSGGFSAGDGEQFEEALCNGLIGIAGATGAKGDKGDKGDTGAQGDKGAKGDTGDRGDTGATGAKGDKGDIGASGARVAFVSRVIPAGALCSTGGTLFSSWTDVVNDTDETGAQVFTATGPVIDYNLKEVPVCNGLAGAKGERGDQGAQGARGDTGAKGTKGDNGAIGDDGFAVVTSKRASRIEECATGGSVIGIYRDNNRSGAADAGDLELHSLVTCNGPRGSDGFTSIIGSEILAPGSTECPTGGVRYSLCLDTDRSNSCNTGDGGRSSPYVCNGANALITMSTLPGTCGGAGGHMIASFTDIDNDGVLSGRDTNIRANMICNGAQGERGVQGNAASNDVVSIAIIPDTMNRCAVPGSLTQVIGFTDTNGNGTREGSESISRSFEFCSGDTTASRQQLMAEISSLVSSYIATLSTELTESIIGLSHNVSFVEISLNNLLATHGFLKTRIAAMQAQLAPLDSKIETLNTQAIDIDFYQVESSGALNNIKSQANAIQSDLQTLTSSLLHLDDFIPNVIDRIEFERQIMSLQGESNQIEPLIAGLQSAYSNAQGLVTRNIQYSETNLCPLGTGGTLISLCSVIDSNTCDAAKAISSSPICNGPWNGVVVSGVVKGLGANGLVLENAGVQQTVNLDFDGTNDVPFKFLVLPNQAYNIAVKTLPANTTCSPVVNGSGTTGTSNISNIVVNCVTAGWTGTKIIGGNTSQSETRLEEVNLDASGNIYASGFTTEALEGNAKLGYGNSFITKYSSSGMRQWTKLYGTASNPDGYTDISDTEIDKNGNIFICGYSSGSLDGIEDAPNSIFIAKLDNNGTISWFKSLGNNKTYINDMILDSQGSVILTGFSYENISGTNTSNYLAYFVAKFDTNGAQKWIYHNPLPSSFSSATSLAIDSKGSIFVTGYSNGAIDSVAAPNSESSFLAKFNGEGEREWTKLFGSTITAIYEPVITINQSDELILTSTFTGSIYGLTSTGEASILINKLNSSGEILSSNTIENHSSIYGVNAILDSKNNLILSGSTSERYTGNPLIGVYDVFVDKLNTSFTSQWARSIGGTAWETTQYDYYSGEQYTFMAGGNTFGRSLATDRSDNIFVAGYGDGYFENIPHNSLVTGFIVKFDANGVKQ